jgi:type II secretory pathway component PulM
VHPKERDILEGIVAFLVLQATYEMLEFHSLLSPHQFALAQRV